MDSLRADTPDWIELTADGPTFRVHLVARSPTSARATLDDLLACVRAAERTLATGSASAPTEEKGGAKGLDRAG